MVGPVDVAQPIGQQVPCVIANALFGARYVDGSRQLAHWRFAASTTRWRHRLEGARTKDVWEAPAEGGLEGSTKAKPKRDRGRADSDQAVLQTRNRVQADGIAWDERACWRDDSQRCSAVPQRCEMMVWLGCIRHGPSALGASEDYRTPAVRGRRRKPSQALQRALGGAKRR